MAGTNWGGYNLPAIWAMLEGENVCTGADRVLAWDGLATSVREQHRRLLQSAEELAAVWPPERNDSAKVFLGQISELAASMGDTLARAEDTRVGLRGVLEAIGGAQTTIRSLAGGRSAVSDDWVPRFVDHAEDEYDEQAQQVMREAEAAIGDHSAQIQAPALYFMGGENRTGGTDFGDDGGSSSGGSASGALRATPIPVAVPHDPVLTDPAGDAGSSGGSPAGSGSGPGSGQDSSLGIGPGLAGVSLPAAAPVAGTGPVVAPAAGTGGLPGGLPGGVIGGGALGLVPGAGGLGGFGGLGAPIGGFRAAGGRQAVSMRRGLPSGAVISGGGIEAGAGRGGSAGQMPLGGQAGRRGVRKDGSEPTARGAADEQWETLDGVTPVIVADTTEVRHDPGPGVLGYGR